MQNCPLDVILISILAEVATSMSVFKIVTALDFLVS